MNIFIKILLQVKNFLFPGSCALCGCSLGESLEIRYSLCIKCQSELDTSIQLSKQSKKCDLCGKPLVSEIGTCLPCRNNTEHSYEKLYVFFPYIGKYRELLTAYKFRKNLTLADFFADKIIEELLSLPDYKNIVIVPVPPRPGKIKDTGWDQVDHLINRMKKNPLCPAVYRCLKRKKSKVQKSLNRIDRIENLKGRIYMKGLKYLQKTTSDKIFFIIDDVITTGSTIEVCSDVLKENGIQRVNGLCLFYD